MQELRQKWLFAIYDKLMLGLVVLFVTLTVQKAFDESKFVKQLTIQNALSKAAVKSGVVSKTLECALETSQRLLNFVATLEPSMKAERMKSARTIYELQGDLFLLQATTGSLLGKTCSLGELHGLTIKLDRELISPVANVEDLRGREWSKRQSDLVREVSDLRTKVVDCFQKALLSISADEVLQATSSNAGGGNR